MRTAARPGHGCGCKSLELDCSLPSLCPGPGAFAPRPFVISMHCELRVAALLNYAPAVAMGSIGSTSEVGCASSFADIYIVA